MRVRLLSRPGLRRAGSACSWAVRRPNWKTPSTELNIGSLSSSFTQPGHSPRTLLGPRTVGHGSLSGCTLLVDLERELVIVQVRRQAGPKYGEWLSRFVQAAVESSATH